MNYHSLLKQLAVSFHTANYELFLVGGAVRDELRGIAPHEFDMATNAPPEEIKKLLRAHKPNALFAIGEKFGTIGSQFGEWKVEITTYRGDKYFPGSRHPEVSFGKTLTEDLSRRDFTINAIAKDLETGEYIDPFGGKKDLESKTIRVVGEMVTPHPSKKDDRGAKRFQEDPLRILRAIRFAVTLNFTIDPQTASFMKEMAAELGSISSERIAQELDRMLVAERPSQGIRLMSDLGLLPYILPEFIALQNVQHEHDEHKDIYEHTLTVLDHVPATRRLRWMALLHDIAKPQTKGVVNGEIHFFEHELLGAKTARRILERLHYDRQFIENIAKLIQLHLRVNQYSPDWTDGAVRRLMREAGDLLDDLAAFSYADITSARPEKVRRGHRRIDEFKERVEKIREQEEVEKIKSPLSGDELMKEFNRPAGRWIQETKDYLLDLVIEGNLGQEDKTAARKLAKEFLNKV